MMEVGGVQHRNEFHYMVNCDAGPDASSSFLLIVFWFARPRENIREKWNGEPAANILILFGKHCPSGPTIPLLPWHLERNMANGGWYGTDEEWIRIEAPLGLLDPELERFARKHDLRVTKNHKDWPERSLAWGDKIQCMIQVFLVDQSTLTLNLWICAWEDRAGTRYWKEVTLLKAVQASEMASKLFELLETGKSKLDHWSAHPEELQFATKLAR